MSKAQGWVIALLLFLVLGVLSAHVYLNHASRSEAGQWEYMVQGFSDETLIGGMNLLGNDGWELASARRAISGEGSSSKGMYECIFKRRVRPHDGRLVK